MESQSAMSVLMIEMAREMNQRSLQHPLPQQQQQQVGQDPNPSQAAGQQGVRLEDTRRKWRWTRNGFQLCQCQDGSLGPREEKNCWASRIGWRSSVVGWVPSMMLMDQSFGKLSMQITLSSLVDHLKKWCGVNVYSTSFNNSLWAAAK